MKRRGWKLSLILMTIAILLIIGVKFDGSLSNIWKQREDFISNIQMGGDRYTFSFASIRHYMFHIIEPYAMRNILGNIGPFVILAFLACGAFPGRKILYSWLYCLFWGIGIEVFQYLTWFGAFDISDIVLRAVGILVGILGYSIKERKT